MRTTAKTAGLLACIPAVLLLSARSAAAQGTEIHVLCSNGFRAAMEKLRPEAEHASGASVKIEFGASANFKRAIDSGQPFDIAILTPQIIADLSKEGKVASGTAMDLASSGIGFAVRAGQPKPDVSTAPAIKQTLLAAKSIGYVQVGAGTPAILAMLHSLGIEEALKSKTIFQTGAEQSMKNLASGQVDITLALISEILPASGVQLAGPLPAEFQKRIILTAGIAGSTKHREAAARFIKALTGASALPAIQSAGLEPIEKEK